MRVVLCAAAAISLIACFSPDYPKDLSCAPDGWCPPGQTCNAANMCVATSGGGGDGGAGGPDATPGPDADNGLGALMSISIGDDVTIPVGGTHQFTVTGIYENGTQPITDFAIWESDNNSVMYLDFNGLATGAAAGTATATARYDGRVDSAIVTVTP